jgi:hypothetical protein
MKTRMLLSLWILVILAIGTFSTGQARSASVTLSNGASCTATQVVVTCAGATVPTLPPVDVQPPPPPPSQPSAGCNAGAIQPQIGWGDVLQARQASGEVRAYPLLSPQDGRSSIQFTQGQQPSTAAGTITEYTVSQCPGKIDPAAGACYYRGPFANYNSMDIYSRYVGVAGCLATSPGQYYVNVRWTYAVCPFGACGFSLQWGSGPY